MDKMEEPITEEEQEINVSDLIKYYLNMFKNQKIVEKCTSVEVVIHNNHRDRFASPCDYLTIFHCHGEGKPMELFVKRALVNPGVTDARAEHKNFSKESEFFHIWVSKLESFITSRTLKTKKEYMLDMIPQCLYASNEFIIMENLIKQGYVVLDKLSRQDFHHAVCVMKSLAKFHAPSYLMIKRDKRGLDKFLARYPCLEDRILGESRIQKHLRGWLSGLMSGVRDILQRHSSPETSYAVSVIDKLMTSDILSIAQTNFWHEDGHICFVVNHGDCWNNNMMFLMDKSGQKIVQHVLIDFQSIRVGSPNLDISSYLFTSLKHSVRRQKWDTLLSIYYDSLVECVSILNGSLDFSYEEFLVDFKRKFVSGFLFGVARTCSFEALEGIDSLNNVYAKICEHVHNAVDRWVEKCPEKAEKLGQELADMFQEFKGFIQGNPEFEIFHD